MKNLFRLAIIAITCLLVVGCGGGLVGLNSEQNPSLTLTTLGSFNSKLKISLPFKLHKESLQVPENLRAMILGHEYYTGDSKLLGISVMEGLYNKSAMPANWKPSLEGAAEGSINSVSKVPGVKNFSSNQKKITISGKPAIIVTMTYDNSQGKKHEQKLLIVIDGYVSWLITAIYSQSSEAAKSVTNQVFSSVSIEK